MFNGSSSHLNSQQMIADTVRLIRQCQKDHMGQYSDDSFLISLRRKSLISFIKSVMQLPFKSFNLICVLNQLTLKYTNSIQQNILKWEAE